ncbi:AAA family ATPase [Microvirga sp. G4-2]|uniref:AAA family ATPase n=1 Tax=Microvirga sp. G4-2 TaxID=3434467 RepID=UPI0040443B49
MRSCRRNGAKNVCRQFRPAACLRPDSADPTDTLAQLLDFCDRARDGWVLDTAALYATLAFSRGDIGTDALYYAEDIRPHLPTDSLRAAADRVIQQPNPASVRLFGKACLAWLYTVDAAKADRKGVAVVPDAIQRVDLYSAACGNVDACRSAAVHAYEHARVDKNSVMVARYGAVAIGLLAQAQAIADGDQPIRSMTGTGWLLKSITRLRLISDALDEHRDAARALSGTQDDDPVADLLSDMPDADQPRAPDVHVQADLDALLDAAAASRPVIEQQPLPTIVVLESLSHLPESKSSSSPNPRLEFAPMAGIFMPLAETPDLQSVSQQLVAEMPWAEDVITTLLMDSVGSAVSRVRNTLLLGKPGSGKTRLARRVGEILGMQPTIVPAAGAADASFGGTNRQWSTSRASVPLQTIKRTGIANPLIVLDEIEKAGDGTHNGNMLDVLIPFLETESAKRHHDPYLECAVDLSMACYIATANASFRLSGPLLDRLRTIEVPQLRRQDLPVVAKTILSEIRQERGEDEIWCPDLDGDELDILAKQWRGGSLRPLRRMIDVLLAGRMSLAPRH